MARTKVNRHKTGRNSVRIVGNSDLNLSTSYMEMDTTFNPNSGVDWTLSFWVDFLHTGATASYNYGMSIYAQLDGSGTGRNWISSQIGTGILVASFNGVTLSSTYTAEIGRWRMVTLSYTRSGGVLRWYIDKTLFATNSGITIENATGFHRFGANKGTVRAGDMYIAESRLFTGKAYSASEVAALFDSDTSVGTLIYQYLMNEQSGVPVDTSGNNVISTLANSAAINTNQSFVPFPIRAKVSRSKVSRTKV